LAMNEEPKRKYVHNQMKGAKRWHHPTTFSFNFTRAACFLFCSEGCDLISKVFFALTCRPTWDPVSQTYKFFNHSYIFTLDHFPPRQAQTGFQRSGRKKKKRKKEKGKGLCISF
jgi:hypothetical protein